MKWIKEIVEKHVNDDGVLDLEAMESELNKKAPEHVIPKEQYNNKVEELNDTKETLSDIQADNKDNETLQTKVNDLETKLEEKEQEATKQAKVFAVNKAWTGVGAEDVEYFTDKYIDDIEIDEDGNLTNFDDVAKEQQTKHPKLFKQVDDKKKDKDGMTIIDNKLDKGERSPSLTKEKIMEIEDTTERQQKIKENMDLFK